MRNRSQLLNGAYAAPDGMNFGPYGGGGGGPRQPSDSLTQPFTPQQLADDAAAGAYILKNGKKRTQDVYTTTFVPTLGSSTVVTLPVQPWGLATKFIIDVSTVITNPAGGSTLTRTGLGPFAHLANITFVDPAQQTRISTPGYHLAAVTARRHRRVPGAAYTTDSPSGYGSVIQPIAAPATIAANASGTVNTTYEVPLRIHRNSLMGSVIAGTPLTTISLQITFGAGFCQNSTDPLLLPGGSVYTGAGAGANAPTYSTTVKVYQEYFDQFPLGLLSAMSPSLSTYYELKTTSISPIVANLDNAIRFTPLRQYWSTYLLFDNNGALNAATDLNYISLQQANQTLIWKRFPRLQSYVTRSHFGDDFPAGTYMLDYSDDPIITAAEGNILINFNPSSSTNGIVYVGWEDIAVGSVLATAPSLTGTSGS